MRRLKKILSLVLAVVMAATMTPVNMTYAATQPTAPSDGTVSGCPFVYGTGGSNSYRIPSMVTLSDGTLVAAADARWNTTYDGGCGDTVVARSSDNGSTWNYTFANYLGDNGNSYNASSSTCFIDPALAVDSDDKIYMLVDLYPYGVALNGADGKTNPSTASGFNSDGTLKLSANGSNYNYYLKDGQIYNSSNTAVSGYTVDAKFNVYQNGTYVSNLFFSDSPYKVVRTGYLYLTTSTDKGATWSDPTLLPNIKTTSEQVCLVGPGRGNVLSDGTIMFPIYSYNGSNDSQYCGFIYSTDNGATWTRSNSSINWSSEAAIVELNSTTLRVFYRNGNSAICYVDVTKSGNNYTWGNAVTTSVGCNSNTQLSAIKVTSGGTDYILVSCPGNVSAQSGASYRKNGKIFTFKASDMSTVKTTSVPSVHTDESFMYSCMSQLKSGNVAILYEDQENKWGYGDDCYYQMSFKTYSLSDLGIPTYTYSVACDDADNTLTVGGTANVTATGTASDSSTVDLSGVTWASSDSNVVSVSGSGKTATITAQAAGTATITATLNGTDIDTVDITVKEPAAGEVTYRYSVSCDAAGNSLALNGTATVTATCTASDGSTVDLSDVTWASSADSVVSVSGTGATATITANAAGTATITATRNGAEIGTVEIQTYENIVDVNLKVGESNEYAATAETASEPDTGIATAEIATTSGNGYTAVTSITSGKKYLMAVNTNYVLTSTISSSNSWSINGYTTTSATVSSGAISGTSYDSYLWTFTKLDDGNYSIQNASGQYLAIDEDNPDVKSWGTNYPVKTQDSAYEFTVNAASGTVSSANNSKISLNNFGGANTCVAGYTGASDITFYEQNPGSSTLTITGVTAGTTSTVVGSTKYNITVSPIEQAKTTTVTLSGSTTLNPTVPDGGSVSYKVTAGNSLITLGNDGKVTAGATAGTATVVATVKASNGNVYATYTYTITVTEIQTTTADLSVAQLADAEIKVGDLSSGQYVEWTTEDASIAAVGAVYDDSTTPATATNKATVLGNAAGTTTITGTVKNEDGSTAAIYIWNTTVTAASDDNEKTRHIYVKVKQITDCTVYYAINGGELIKLAEPDANGYVALDADYTGHFNIAFFAAPKDGYALTYMGITGTNGDYYALANGNSDGTGSSAWPMVSNTATQTDVSSASGGNDSNYFNTSCGFRWAIYQGNMTLARLKAVYSQAIALGCVGTTTFTKNDTTSFYCEVQFAASELPKVTKTVTSITPKGSTESKEYQPGDKIGLGDKITYTIKVTEPAYLTGDVYYYTVSNGTTTHSYTVTSPITDSNKPQYTENQPLGTITYANVSLTDELTGNDGISAPSLGTTTASEQTFTYTTSFTLTLDNFDKVVNGELNNTAALSYEYTTTYTSSAKSEASADAVAVINVVPEYILDFGLPVTIDVGTGVLGSTTIASGSATYGTVTPSEDGLSFTYTPNKVIQGKDFVKLTLSNGNTYGVSIYPATTVYYEEGFADFTGSSWSSKDSAEITGAISANLLGEGDNYGYDTAYSKATGASNGTTESSTTSGDKATFTFTGTGVDIYATCSESSGMIAAIIKGTKDTTQKLIMINTASISGSTDLTTYPDGDLYNVPITSITGLDHDTYTVTLLKMGTNDVRLDGFRVYNTMEDSTIYKDDLEDSPSFIEVRDLNFGTVDLSKQSEKYASDATEQIYKTFDATQNVNAVITSSTGSEVEASTELIDNGPKNEIYLYKGMTLTLTLTTKREVQIGLRGLQGNITCKINDSNQAVSTVDMFYTVKAQSDSDTETTVTITNPNDTILAITKLKVCDAPDNVICAVSKESIKETLYALGYKDEEKNNEEPETGKNTEETTEEPETGKDTEETTEESETGKDSGETPAAAESGSQTGESSESEESIGNNTVPAKAVESIKLVNYKGKVVASTSLTANGAKGEKASFTASRIQKAVKAALPSGYAIAKASSIKAVKVAYGKTNTLKVLVGKTAKLQVTYKTKNGRKVGTATLSQVQTSSASKYTFKASKIKAAAPARYRVVSLKKGTSVKYGSTGKLSVICR